MAERKRERAKTSGTPASIREALKKATTEMLVLTWGTSMEQAHYRLECLEQLATVTLHLRTLGIHRTMPESLVKALEGLRPAWGIQ